MYIASALIQNNTKKLLGLQKLILQKACFNQFFKLFCVFSHKYSGLGLGYIEGSEGFREGFRRVFKRLQRVKEGLDIENGRKQSHREPLPLSVSRSVFVIHSTPIQFLMCWL